MVAASANVMERNGFEMSFRVDGGHELQSLIQRTVHGQQLRDVAVRLENDQIELTGRVRSWYEKQLAQETVRSMAVAHKIFNQLEVTFG
ncbi:MAG: BON domain-containing protein [Planctomyces sp.]|jgi:hypothetical protein